MGSSLSGGTTTTERLSPLAKTQHKILKKSWDMYLNDIYPEAKEWMQTGGESWVDKLFPQQAAAVNSAYNTAKQSNAQQLAQRGLLGTSSGVEAAAATNLNTARAGSLSEAYRNVLVSDAQRRETNRMNALGMLMGKSPTPTTAAPTLTSSTSNGGILGDVKGLSTLGVGAGLLTGLAGPIGGMLGVGAGGLTGMAGLSGG